MKNTKEIEVDVWYEVKINRKLKNADLIIGKSGEAFKERINGHSLGSTRGLNIKTPMYFGGLNSNF